MLGREYDPNQIAQNFIAMVKIRKFSHEDDPFDDFFEQVEQFSQVFHLASLNLDLGDLR